MITAIIFGVLTFIAGWFHSKKLESSYKKLGTLFQVMRVMMISMLTTAGILVGVLVAGILGALLAQEVLVDEKQLISVEDNFLLKDDYLGTYIIYTREKALVVSAWQVYQGKTSLRETAGDTTGLLKIYTSRLPTGAWYAPFVFEIKIPKYEIFVPRGSILEIKRP